MANSLCIARVVTSLPSTTSKSNEFLKDHNKDSGAGSHRRAATETNGGSQRAAQRTGSANPKVSAQLETKKKAAKVL